MSGIVVNSRSVSPPHWETDVFLIGGGPSAEVFDFSLLCGKQVLSVNAHHHQRAFLAGATAVAAFSLDNRWVRSNRDFLAGFEGEKFVALPLATWPDCAGIPGVTYLEWSHADGFSDDPTRINTGGSSGYGAMNVAWLKRARRMFLIGYDMSEPDYPAAWIRSFRTALPQLASRGVAVYNLNVNSAVDAFPRVRAEEIL